MSARDLLGIEARRQPRLGIVSDAPRRNVRMSAGAAGANAVACNKLKLANSQFNRNLCITFLRAPLCLYGLHVCLVKKIRISFSGSAACQLRGRRQALSANQYSRHAAALFSILLLNS